VASGFPPQTTDARQIGQPTTVAKAVGAKSKKKKPKNDGGIVIGGEVYFTNPDEARKARESSGSINNPVSANEPPRKKKMCTSKAVKTGSLAHILRQLLHRFQVIILTQRLLLYFGWGNCE
jgi:hypothetical protein